MNFTVAVAQIDAAVGNLEVNIATHVKYVEQALTKNADLIVFPELSLTGYSVKDLHWDLAVRAEPNKYFSQLLKLSERITIILGAVEEGENFGIYNSALVFEKGTVSIGHRKIYPPTYGMFEEMRYFSQGKTVRAFPSRFGKLGILICEDMWHLSLPYILMHDGADIILSLTASPTRLSSSNKELTTAVVNHEQHRSYARLLSTYVVFANRVGIEDGVNFWGGSHIVGPSGETLASAPLFDEGLIVATIDRNEVRRARRFSRHVLDDSAEFTIQQLKSSLKRNT